MSRRLRTIIAAFMMWSFAALAHAADISGDWHGVLKTPLQTLRLIVHIDRVEDVYSGYIESPDQGPGQRPIEDISTDKQTLTFKVPSVRGAFSGTWNPEVSQWVGQWTQPGGSRPLTLSKGLPEKRAVVDGLDGSWDGELTVNSTKLRLVLHVFTTPYGTTALLDSPDQMATGIPVSLLTRHSDKIIIEVAAVGGGFSGALSSNSKAIAGEWRQGGQGLPLTFKRREGRLTRNRPQHPVRPYPYTEEPVAFRNPVAGHDLAGTLTLPSTQGPHAVAILISGSGSQDRDGTLLGHKPFLVIADHLTRQGMAVLRFDDRGVGGSGGDAANTTTRDLASDAAAAMAYLRTRKDIDTERIGFIGHSEGGLIGPMVAAENKNTAFLVLLAAPGFRGEDMLIAQQRSIGLSQGQTEAEIKAQEPLMRKIIATISTQADTRDAEAAIRRVIAELPPHEQPSAAVAEALVSRLGSPWMRFFLTYDPAATLAEVDCPVLAIAGSKDLQVAATDNLAAIKRALSSNPDVETAEIPGLNHLFQTASTGAIGEYEDIEETFSPVALNMVSQWLKRKGYIPAQ